MTAFASRCYAYLMAALITLVIIFLILLATGYWWRHHSIACPAGLAWLVENPYTNAIAGPELLLNRTGLSEGMKLLDIGSGPGRLALPASRIVGPSGEVVALDIQSKMLEKLGKRIEAEHITNLRLINAGAGEGKIDRNYFDRALLVTVLGEIPDKQKALAEIFSALKSGGILSVTELIPDPHYIRQKTVRLLCSEAGFQEIDSSGSWFCFTINFKKLAPAS